MSWEDEIQWDQLGLFAGDDPAPSGISLRDRVAHILDQVPEARNNDPRMVFEYWNRYCGLTEQLERDPSPEGIRDWLCTKAENWYGLVRRRQEIQRNRDQDVGHLRPSPSVERYRRARDGAGPPRR